MFRQLCRTAVLTVTWLVLLPCLILLFSAIVPVIPWVRIEAVELVPNRATWLLLIGCGGIAVVLGIVGHRSSGPSLSFDSSNREPVA
jgi:acetyl esterase